MLYGRIHELFYIINLVAACYGRKFQRPLISVSGMSDRLSNSCRVDYSTDVVNISLQIVDVACTSEDSEVSHVNWTFHKMESVNDYEVILNNFHKMYNLTSSSLTWTDLDETDLSIYTVKVSLKLTILDWFTIVGYVVIGCGDQSENYSAGACEGVYHDVKNLAGTNIWDLKKCDDFLTSYKATSREEFVTEGSSDIYSTDNLLKANSPVIFQVKSESHAIILLHENKTDRYNNAVEITLEGQGQISTIGEKKPGRIKMDESQSEDILSEDEFRTFWICFSNGDEVLVGKGHVPFSEQILKLDRIHYDFNYLSFGRGIGANGTWRFDIDLCEIPLKEDCLIGANFWNYNKETMTCVNIACLEQANCFKTKEICQNSCNPANTASERRELTLLIEDPSLMSVETDVGTAATNCQELQQAAKGTLSNGSYSVSNGNGQIFTVYCQFYRGYGYTYVSRNTTIDLNITSLYNNRSHVVIQHKRKNGMQYTAKMEQLSKFSETELLIQYNKHTGYNSPINAHLIPYIYVGFIPPSKVIKSAKEGWQCNGQEFTYTNCDGNINSYMVFYFNKDNGPYKQPHYSDIPLMFCWYSFATEVSQGEYLSDDFFTPYYEIHHGGCGGLATGDAEPDVDGVAVGLQFFLSCSIPEDILYGTKTYSGTNINDTVTYTCDIGYIIYSGDASRTCISAIAWSGTKPVCGEFRVNISCTSNYNCREERNPLAAAKYEVNCDHFTFKDGTRYLWTVEECEQMDSPYTCSDGTVSTTNLTKYKLTIKKNETNANKIIRLNVTVTQPDGSIASASEQFVYSPIPESGECIVVPVSGYTLITNFNITCVNFTVQGNYSFEYLMKSKTVNEWPKGSRFYTGKNNTVSNLKLRLGDPDNEYRLFILVRVKLVESGAYTDVATIVQVLPADQAPDGDDVLESARSLLTVEEDSQSSAIDDMLAAGNHEEAIQNLNVIASALNPVNVTDEVNHTVIEEKIEIRTSVVTSLNKVNVSGIDTVSSVAETLTEVTKVKSELSESTQEMAAELFDDLADSLDDFSNVTDTVDIVDSAEDIFNGVTQLLDIKADEGSKQLMEDKSNITEDVEDDAKLEKIKESAGRLLNTINKISNTLLSGQTTGDPAIVIKTENMSVQVEKIDQSALGGRNLSIGSDNDTDVATIEFPAVVDGLDENMPDLGLQVLHMKKNPYTWDRSAIDVNMEVLSVELTSNDAEVKVTNLSQPIKVSLTAQGTEKPPYSTLLLHIIKSGGNLSYDTSKTNMLHSNFTVPEGKTVILSLFTFFQIRNLKIYINELEKPNFETLSAEGMTYPGEVEKFNQNFSKFDLSDKTPDSSDLIFFTFNKSNSINYTGTYYLGATVDLNESESVEDLRDLDAKCIGNDNITDCKTVVELTIHVDSVVLSCSYWDTESETWSSKGCEVSPLSNKDKLECLCNHLTAFSGGVFVLPNFVDPIEDAALFLTFFDNPVVVTAVVVVWILYFFLIHWARMSDKKDQEQVGVIPVGDIDAFNKHMYLVCVVTGWWTDAGTTANVFFYMKGMNGSSARIKLTTSARLCFQSGYEDWFLVTTDESLGDLHDITLWHDNSGTSPHWYLSQLFVKDLQDKKSWTFIYNDWLAVDRGAALLTTACVPAVTKEELKLKQKHNFMVKTTHDLRDSHIWISIFSKPARSSFTRVQRVTCALSLLLTTMLTNIMFYGIPTDDPEDQVGGSRGVVISLSSIVIGIQSSLIMFPVNVIIMQMFLKLKQKPKKDNFDEKGKTYIESLFERASLVTTNFLIKLSAGVWQPEQEQDTLLEKENTNANMSSSSYYTMEETNSVEDTISDVKTTNPWTFTDYKNHKKGKVIVLSETKEAGKILPWWFLYISWFMVLSVSLVCSYFVMLYGLKYGYQRSVEWLVSFITGFSQSAMITQPLKVLVVAIIITLIFKRTVTFDDYGPEVKLDEDVRFVNSVNKTEEAHIPFSKPLSPGILQKIKQRVQLEWLMDITIRDIILYIFYLAVVCIVVHGHRDIKEAYYNSLAIEDVLINPGCILLYQCFFLASVDNVEFFYKYLREVAVPNLADMSIADHEYATPGSSHFLVGPWRLRQLRVDKGTCGEGADKLFHQFSMNVEECTGPYWLGDEERQNFVNSWSKVVTEPADPPTKWTYQSAWKLKTIPFAGQLSTYSGGGYIITMPNTTSLQEGEINAMWDSDWIDERTRAIFLEFTLYNPNADLFSVVIILFEFSNNGAVLPYHQIFSTRLYHYSTDFANFVLACECFFLIFNISFTYIEWKKFAVLGRKKYFEDYWSYVEIIQIGMSFSVVGLFFQRLVSVNGIMADFRESDGSTFISFYTAISWDFILGYVMAFLIALVTLKAIKLLKFNKRTYMVADTIAHSKSSIASFMALAIIVAIAFAHFATLAFGKTMDEYRDMLKSLVTVFNFSLGVSDFPGLQETNRVLGPIFFCLFVFFITFIFLTVFVAILNFGINESKMLFEKRQNKLELLDYVTTKAKMILNVKT